MTARPRAAVGGAKEQVARLLTLVPYLHARGQVRLDDAASALGVTPSQLLADLRVLLMCGLPGGYPDDLIEVDLDALEEPEGDGVIRVSNADYLTRPLRLSPTEATALIVALRALRDSAPHDTREVVDRALGKLETAAAAGAAAGQVDLADGPDRLADLRARLQRATDGGHQVRLTYYVPARDEESERVVDPRGVVSTGGLDYLDAWCHSAEAPRWFRLDRIHEAEVLDSPVVTDPQPPRDLAEGLLEPGEGAAAATLLLDAAARWVPDYYPVDSVRTRAGHRLEVRMRVADPRWLQRFLLRLTPHVRVVEPAAYAQAYRQTLAATLRLYDGPA